MHRHGPTGGNALTELERFNEALESYNRSLEITPASAYVWNNKGAAMAALGWNQAALECYDMSLAIDPEYEEAWGNKGLVLKAIGRKEEAKDAFAKAGENCPACADG